MEEKKEIKISLGTVICIIIIIILLLTIGGIYYYYNYVTDKTQMNESNNISKAEENLVKANTVKTNEANQNITQNNKANDTNFSEDTIKKSILNYLNVFKGHGAPSAILTGIGLGEYVNNDEYTSDNYIKTNISYEKFIEAIKNYVTEDWFETINNNQQWNIVEFKNVNGMLYYSGTGWTGTEYEVEGITLKGDYSKTAYIAKAYKISIDGSKEEENIEFHIENYNGKCVISYCD
jgi:hypothetical protein